MTTPRSGSIARTVAWTKAILVPAEEPIVPAAPADHFVVGVPHDPIVPGRAPEVARRGRGSDLCRE